MPFLNIKGHDQVIAWLRASIRNNHLAGAYLFSGPEGIGKKLVARNFAKALNCLENNSDACNCCISCRKIETGQHPDLHIIDNGALEEIKIGDIRALQQESSLCPYEGRHNVFIINDAHNLNSEAANAFLKTLEEPAKSSVIILVTDKLRLLFRTIISRCQIVKFSALGREEFKKVLEDWPDLDVQSSRFLSFFCEGRIGSAAQWKDKDIILRKNKVIDFFCSQPCLNASNSFIPLEAIEREKKDTAPLTGFIQNKEILRRGLNIMAGWFRDVYFIKAGLAGEQIINIDRSDTLAVLAKKYSFNELDEILNSIAESMLYLEQNVNVKLLLANLSLSIWKTY